MSTVMTRPRPEELMRAVALLTPHELSEFMLRFDEWQLTRMSPVNTRAAELADAHRLPEGDRLRLAELLTKNREAGQSAQEEGELDAIMGEMDRRLDQVADKLLTIARRRPTQGKRASI